MTKRYTPRDVARMLHVDVRRVEGWREHGFITPVALTGGRQRVRYWYDDTTLTRLRMLLDGCPTCGRHLPTKDGQ